MSNVEEYVDKPKTQKETIDQLWYAVIGTNGHGLVQRMQRVETKVDAHQHWHATNKLAIILAIGGWTVAVITGVVAIL